MCGCSKVMGGGCCLHNVCCYSLYLAVDMHSREYVWLSKLCVVDHVCKWVEGASASEMYVLSSQAQSIWCLVTELINWSSCLPPYIYITSPSFLPHAYYMYVPTAGEGGGRGEESDQNISVRHTWRAGYYISIRGI